MIFCSRNEDDVPAYVLVQERRKTVTRRLKMIETGKIVANQPGRGKKAIGHIRVLSCVSHCTWIDSIAKECTDDFTRDEIVWMQRQLQAEAVREGFRDWNGLLHWFDSHKPHISIYNTFRIEFELVKEDML